MMRCMALLKHSCVLIKSNPKIISVFLLIFVGVGILFLWRYARSPGGKANLDEILIRLPIFGNLYKKLYLSRIADNLNTMLSSGISIVRALEITSATVGNQVYKNILKAPDQFLFRKDL